jgi:cytochrome c biogenesis protein CcdA
VVAGVVLLVGAGLLWHKRASLARRELPTPSAGGKSSLLLGLTIGVVEFPTAFPYFAAIAAIVGSGYGLGHQLVYIAIYNVAFVLPMLLILGTLEFAGNRAQTVLSRGRDLLQKYWPVVLAALALVAGVFVTVLGVTGLASQGHGPAAKFSRGVRKLLH